jgi:hypothetical protein
MTNSTEPFTSDPEPMASKRHSDAVSQPSSRRCGLEGAFVTCICLLILMLSGFGSIRIYGCGK